MSLTVTHIIFKKNPKKVNKNLQLQFLQFLMVIFQKKFTIKFFFAILTQA